MIVIQRYFLNLFFFKFKFFLGEWGEHYYSDSNDKPISNLPTFMLIKMPLVFLGHILLLLVAILNLAAAPILVYYLYINSSENSHETSDLFLIIVLPCSAWLVYRLLKLSGIVFNERETSAHLVNIFTTSHFAKVRFSC